jgi:hypothetical protein
MLGPAEEKDLEILLHTKLKRLQGCMADRHTVWIMGDLGSGAAGEANFNDTPPESASSVTGSGKPRASCWMVGRLLPPHVL